VNEEDIPEVGGAEQTIDGEGQVAGGDFANRSTTHYDEKQHNKERDSGSVVSPPITPNPGSVRSPNQSPNLTTTFAEFQQPTRPPHASYGGSLFGKRRVSRAPTVIPRERAITQEDLVNSAERVFARYLVQGAEKEIYLP
jgi:hypothetical protein